MKQLLFFCGAIYLFTAGCALDDEEFSVLDQGVFAGTDTLSFDTLIAGRQSFVQRFRIYNPSPQDISIDNISLENGSASAFRLIINGEESTAHRSVQIASNDSLLLLVYAQPEVEADFWIREVNDLLTWEDPLTAIKQSVYLQSWAISATERETNVICDETWPSLSATVVKDTLVVDANCHLRIEAGARVFFDPEAVLFVAGRLTIEGSNESPVLLRSSRMDGSYRQAPGLWDGVYFLEGSQENLITNTIIENSATGLRVGTPDNDSLPDVIIDRTIIRHSSQFGIQAYNSDIKATNLLIYDVGLVPAFHAIGGSYDYLHCTFTNFPSQLGSQEPSVIFADHLITDNETLEARLSLRLKNSILWAGGADSDLQISLIGNDNSVDVERNIIFGEGELVENVLSNELDFVHFLDPFSFDYQLDSLSPAIDTSLPSDVLFDLGGNLRDSLPDIGAYEYVH